MFRWPTLKGLAALILFIISATVIEYLIVVYAINIGVRDEVSFQIPWLGFTVSPLFHLVPISTIIVLAASWTCLAKYVATKPAEKIKQSFKKAKASEKEERGEKARISGFLGKIKAGLLRIRGVAYVWDRLNFAKATVKSAITILLVFLALALLVSILANPWLVYRTFANLYQSNPQILGFVMTTKSALQGFAEAAAPIGWICSSINNALIAAAPSIRDFASTLGVLTKPLADSPPFVKYLAFQNIAAWVSALAVLFYGAYTRKSYRYRRVKKV